MKVAVAYDHLDVRIEERPEPELQPGSLLVDMHACGVCTTDVLAWYVRSKAPVVLGHEAEKPRLARQGAHVALPRCRPVIQLCQQRRGIGLRHPA